MIWLLGFITGFCLVFSAPLLVPWLIACAIAGEELL